MLEPDELTGSEPQDGYPVVLTEWIARDGLKCLKVKLRGNDRAWDYSRMVRVGTIAFAQDVEWLSADFNCTVKDPVYVNEILDRLKTDHREIFDRVLYVEQPFPYDLEAHRLDVRSVSALALSSSLVRSVAFCRVSPASVDRAIVSAIASCCRQSGIVFAIVDAILPTSALSFCCTIRIDGRLCMVTCRVNFRS